ncbi:MAG: N-acetyltransferase [Anaerolineaceae bacterium]|nr:N-acetyltransferase [Anaerolineaceae bacterium]
MFIHPSADVEDGAQIGENTKVWHLCHIRRDAHIGRDCVLGRGVFVDAGVQIGNAVKIQNYVSVFHGVTIEDGVFVGPHVCFTNDLFPRAVNPDMSLKAADDWVMTETRIKAGAAIGANSTLVCGITVGRWAMIGSGSVVTKDVPDYALVVGNPARIIGYVTASGQRVATQEAAMAAD